MLFIEWFDWAQKVLELLMLKPIICCKRCSKSLLNVAVINKIGTTEWLISIFIFCKTLFFSSKKSWQKEWPKSTNSWISSIQSSFNNCNLTILVIKSVHVGLSKVSENGYNMIDVFLFPWQWQIIAWDSCFILMLFLIISNWNDLIHWMSEEIAADLSLIHVIWSQSNCILEGNSCPTIWNSYCQRHTRFTSTSLLDHQNRLSRNVNCYHTKNMRYNNRLKPTRDLVECTEHCLWQDARIYIHNNCKTLNETY